jgi:hypothetical protein
MTTREAVSGIVRHRVDELGGFRETVGYFGNGEGRRFGWSAIPVTPPTRGLVVCSPIHADATKQYRREVLLGRRLAASGIAVQRFHYRGFGNSDGSGADATLETMREDAVAAASALRESADLEAPAFLGIGWGALVAAEVVRSTDQPLALWQPTLDASRFFENALRALAIRELKEGRASVGDAEGLMDDLRRTGSLDVLGYSLERALVDSAGEARLEPSLLDRPRRVLLVQVDRAKSLRGELRELADRLVTSGCAVDTHVVEAEDRSWFIDNEWNVEEDRESTKRLLDLTAAWLGADGTDQP